MRRTNWLLIGVALLVLAVGVGYSLPAAAQPAGQMYTMNWWTVDGGGATFSTGGGYSLGGTAGQPDAGMMAGGGYTLGSGFWKGGWLSGAHRIYLPLVVRSW